MLVLAAPIPFHGADLPFRDWQHADGNRLRARMVGMQSSTVVIRMLDGSKHGLQLHELSPKDRDYVSEWKHAFEKPAAPQHWPAQVRVKLDGDVRSAGATSGYAYETRHFRFRSDVKLAQSLISQYSKVFESTYQAVMALPGNLGVQPDGGKLQVRLFKRLTDYLNAGGQSGSSGNYSSLTREIMVPLSSLGVRITGAQVVFNSKTYYAAPLMHEITHQLMHDWISVFPVWFTEGIAEYVSVTPFDGDRFDFAAVEAGIKERFNRSAEVDRAAGGVYTVDMVDPEQLMSLTHEAWSRALSDQTKAGRNYRSAMLLVYYFAHLDGAGDASGLISYAGSVTNRVNGLLRERNQAVDQWNADWQRYADLVEDYNAGLTKFRQDVRGYNQRVAAYNQQLARRVPQQERITVGPKPVVPVVPVKPERPAILADPEKINADIDSAVTEAGEVLLGGRSLEQLWAEMERGFATKRIRIRKAEKS